MIWDGLGCFGSAMFLVAGLDWSWQHSTALGWARLALVRLGCQWPSSEQQMSRSEHAQAIKFPAQHMARLDHA
jgi:hypothetical protein